MQIDLSIDPPKIADKLVFFIKNTLKKTGFSRLVIGLSGGIDSATSLVLAIEAVGKDNVLVCLFPYGDLNQEGVDDSKRVIDKFHIPQNNIKLIDIKPLVDSVINANPTTDNLRCGNIMVRMRMILLYDLSKKVNGLVLGTENKTEYLLGYFTRFGDEASDIEPLRNMYKTQVRQLALYLKVPQKIIEKPPTAGMFAGQTDEREFGFSYEEADQILFFWHDKKYKKEAIVAAGYSLELVEKVIGRVKNNDFKHHLPHTP